MKELGNAFIQKKIIKWLNGKREGIGTMYYKNGKIQYQGYFKNDKYEGNGKFLKKMVTIIAENG